MDKQADPRCGQSLGERLSPVMFRFPGFPQAFIWHWRDRDSQRIQPMTKFLRDFLSLQTQKEFAANCQSNSYYCTSSPANNLQPFLFTDKCHLYSHPSPFRCAIHWWMKYKRLPCVKSSSSLVLLNFCTVKIGQGDGASKPTTWIHHCVSLRDQEAGQGSRSEPENGYF